VGVPQIVEADLDADAPRELEIRVRELLRLPERPILAGEDEPIVLISAD